jgi:hypothetical protein
VLPTVLAAAALLLLLGLRLRLGAA